GADRICFGILLSCIVTGTDACPRGALSRTGPVSFPCSAIAVDEPARKTNTAKAANVVIRFMKTNPFWTTGPFLADFIGSVQRTLGTGRVRPALGPAASGRWPGHAALPAKTVPNIRQQV